MTDGYRELRTGAGLVCASARGTVFVRGGEAASFCQGFVTNDMLLPVGKGCYALAVGLKGHIICDLVASRVADDGLLFSTQPGQGGVLAAHFDRYLISEDAAVDDASERFARLSLAGPQAAELLGQVLEALPASEGACVALGDGWCIRSAWSEVRGHDAAAPCYDLVVPRAQEAALRARLEAAGAVAVEARDLALLCLENARPGHEVLSGCLPQEADLERAVSYTKGCYLGQETVARVHYRGGVKKMLSALRASRPVPVGGALQAGDKEVGKVLACEVVPGLPGALLHVALLRLENREVGAVVQAEGQDLTVLAWPLA